MQLVVVMAVRNAVSAATATFTAISITLFFIIHLLFILTQISLISQIFYSSGMLRSHFPSASFRKHICEICEDLCDIFNPKWSYLQRLSRC